MHAALHPVPWGLLAAAWCAVAVPAQRPAALLRDLRDAAHEQGPVDAVLLPGASVGGMTFFGASEPGTDLEPWITDGTAAGTRLLKDLMPGGSSWPCTFTSFQGAVYIAAMHGGERIVLWRSDGTSAGTTLLRELPTRNVSPPSLLAVNQRLYIAAGDLWTSDGTVPGTRQVPNMTDLVGSLEAVGSTLFCTRQDPNWTRGLWSYDTLGGGARRLTPVTNPDVSASAPLLATARHVFFAGWVPPTLGLWSWDTLGMAATRLTPTHVALADPWTHPRIMASNGATVFFAATDTVSGNDELWQSDGTAAGTRRVLAGSPGFAPRDLTPSAGQVFFLAGAAANTGLWRTDGTSTANLGPAPDGHELRRAGTRLFFRTGYGSDDSLWQSDGNTLSQVAGVLVSSAGNSGWASPSLTPGTSNGVVYFPGRATPSEPLALWRSDGTPAGTLRVRHVQPPWANGSFPWFPKEPPPSGGLTFFAHDGTTSGMGLGLWHSDGSGNGTTLVANGLGPALGLTPAWGQLFFTAHLPVSGLWTSDGTVAGTRLVQLFGRWAWPGRFGDLITVGDHLFVTATDTLWQSDGTRAGTSQRLDPLSGVTEPLAMVALGDALVFVDEDPVTQAHRLWRLHAQSEPEFLRSFPGDPPHLLQLVVFQDAVHFVADDGVLGAELWRSDGTILGTVPVCDIQPGPLASSPEQLVVSGDSLYFVASDARGPELWRSDGTWAGTTLVKDITPDPGAPVSPARSPQRLTAFAGGVLMFAHDGATGYELWRSQGTAASTVRLTDAMPGSGWGTPRGVLYAPPGCDHALFSAADPDWGHELWITDGTPAGTRRWQDLRPGSRDAQLGLPVLAGTSVYFAADDGVHGIEPWVMPGMAAAVPYGQGCAGSGPRVPGLGSSGGAPRVGNGTFQIELRGARPHAAGVVVLADGADALALGEGCRLLVRASRFADLLPLTADATGAARVQVAIPGHPALRGAQVFAQALVLDPSGPILRQASLSDGLRILVSDW